MSLQAVSQKIPLSDHPVFGFFDQDIIDKLTAGLEPVMLEADDVLLRQGDPGDAMYLLDDGLLQVYLEQDDGATQISLNSIVPGSIVGELALISGQPRNATVVASEPSVLFKLSRTSFETLVEQYPEVEAAMSTVIQPRIQRKQLAEMLSSLLGDSIGQDTVQNVQARSEWITLLSGEMLFHEDDPADALYIVVNGRLRASAMDSNGLPIDLGEVGAGETVGEYALLTNNPRTASVFAIRDSSLIKVSADALQTLLANHPQAVFKLAQTLINRQVRQYAPEKDMNPRAMTMCLVPLDDVARYVDLCQAIEQALGVYGKTLVLTADRFNALYGNNEASQMPFSHALNNLITHWLNSRENEYKYIIYVADQANSNWTQRCARQSDRILLIGDANDTAPDQQDWERTLLRSHPNTQTDLILVHDTLPSDGARYWLAERHVDSVFHLKKECLSSRSRLARMLSGNAVGLVLAGGGARGMAHVGVIRALEEAGYEIDYVGGTSMGALVGAAYARGADWHDLADLAKRFSDPKLIKDPTVPITALMSGRKVTRILKSIYGDETYIEDLPRKFFCVASNLSRARPEIFHQGLLWRSVRGSMAIPSIFPPIIHQDDILVDGALMNNFPLDIMRREVGSGTVIGIDVNPVKTKRGRPYDFGSHISGWRVLLSRINPFAQSIRVPSINSVVMRSMFVNSNYQFRNMRGIADMLITPQVSAYGVLDYDKYEEIVEYGYQAALQALEKSSITV